MYSYCTALKVLDTADLFQKLVPQIANFVARKHGQMYDAHTADYIGYTSAVQWLQPTQLYADGRRGSTAASAVASNCKLLLRFVC